jgi:hypothetical protein
VKTTLDIDDELLIKAKAASARERKSLTALIEEGLRLRLRRPGAIRLDAGPRPSRTHLDCPRLHSPGELRAHGREPAI